MCFVSTTVEAIDNSLGGGSIVAGRHSACELPPGCRSLKLTSLSAFFFFFCEPHTFIMEMLFICSQIRRKFLCNSEAEGKRQQQTRRRNIPSPESSVALPVHPTKPVPFFSHCLFQNIPLAWRGNSDCIAVLLTRRRSCQLPRAYRDPDSYHFGNPAYL